MRRGDFERSAIAGGKQRLLIAPAARPNRPDRVNDMAGLELESRRDFRVARWAAAELPAGLKELRPGRAVNRAIDPAAARELGIGGVDDRIDVERRDVGDEDFEPGRRGARP